MRRLLALLAIVGMLHLIYVGSVIGATPNVGQHIHVLIHDHPVAGHPITKSFHTYTGAIILHEFPIEAGVRYLRVDNEKGEVKRVTFNPILRCATDTCSFPFTVTIDMRSWSTGSHELRWHADSSDSDPNLSGTQRQFTTSRFQVCVASCSPAYRKPPFLGGGSWYTKHDYQVPLIRSADTDIKPGGRVVIDPGCAYLNPDFHHGSHGTFLGCDTTITIPSSAHVGDSLVVVEHDGFEAGVIKVPLGNGSPRSTWDIETQSWWADTGLKLP
jgi:hypothetical protein